METQVTITITHPDDAPINWFKSYTLERYFREISADMDNGWAIRVGGKDEQGQS
jgi:hypothetical protein